MNDNDNKKILLLKDELIKIKNWLRYWQNEYYFKFDNDNNTDKLPYFFNNGYNYCCLCGKYYKRKNILIEHINENHNDFIKFIELLNILLYHIDSFEKRYIVEFDLVFIKSIIDNMNFYKYSTLLQIPYNN